MGEKTCCLLLCLTGNEKLPRIQNKDQIFLDGMTDQARSEPQKRQMTGDTRQKNGSYSIMLDFERKLTKEFCKMTRT